MDNLTRYDGLSYCKVCSNIPDYFIYKTNEIKAKKEIFLLTISCQGKCESKFNQCRQITSSALIRNLQIELRALWNKEQIVL